MTGARLEVSELVVYPIKSAGGIALQEVDVTERGFALDRRFLVVDAEGRFLSQREHPRMATLRTSVQGSTLVVEAPHAGRFPLPLLPESGPARRVTVWNDEVVATSLGPSAAAFFTAAIGVPCELVHLPESSRRPCDPRYAEGKITSFADGFPFLLTTTASLDALNAKLDTPVPMDRFRANLVVSGAEPFEEDDWRALRIGAIRFFAVKPCARCAMPGVDQATGAQGREPMRTLATFRTQGGKVYFGQNLVHEGEGAIRVGDLVVVEA